MNGMRSQKAGGHYLVRLVTTGEPSSLKSISSGRGRRGIEPILALMIVGGVMMAVDVDWPCGHAGVTARPLHTILPLHSHILGTLTAHP